MEQNRRRKKKKRLKNNEFLSAVLMLCALIQIIYHSILTGIIGDMGMGYYGMTATWILLFMASAGIGVPYITSRLLTTRLIRNQTRNAIKMFQVIAVSILLLNALAVALSIVFAQQIGEFILHEMMLAFPLRVAIPLVLLFCLLQILRGYFQSFGTDMPSGISVFLEQAIMLGTSLAFSTSMYHRGQKIGAFLHNDNYAALYGATGAFLGMYIGSVLSLIFLFVLFWLHYKTWKRQAQKDATIRLEGNGVLIRNFVLSYLPLFIIGLVVMVSQIVDLAVFRKTMENRGALADATRQWGIYMTKYQVLILLPLAGIIAFAATGIKGIAGAYLKKDSAEMKRKLSFMMRKSIRVFLLVSGVYTILAKTLHEMLFKGDLVTSTTILRSGGLLPVFMAIGLLTGILLLETGYGNMVLLTACISSALQVVLFVLLLNMGKMHIQGIVIADVIAMAVFAMMNMMFSQKVLHYRQEYIRTFVMPFAATFLSGIVMFLLQLLLDSMPALLCFIICFTGGSITYGVCLVLFKAIGEEELYDLPGGEKLVSIAKMCRLL